MPDTDSIGLACVFRKDPPICVQDDSPEHETEMCSFCADTLPQILSDALESKRNLITDNARYEEMRQKIERKWKTTAADGNSQFFCVARQSRFRNPSNPSGKRLLEGVVAARKIDKGWLNEERSGEPLPAVEDEGHIKCLPVKQPGWLCEECSVAVGAYKPEIKDLFNEPKLVQLELELTDDVIRHAEELYPYQPTTNSS